IQWPVKTLSKDELEQIAAKITTALAGGSFGCFSHHEGAAMDAYNDVSYVICLLGTLQRRAFAELKEDAL
ncbi:hypothetical protein HDU93_002838, partial [Gonapodya sp. JEL0774]